MDLIEKIKQENDLSQYEGVGKVVLAYSGGLDTSVMIKLFQDVIGAEVVTFTADLGQKEYAQEELKSVEQKAYSLGVKKHYFLDLKKEFVEEYCWKALKANCLYQNDYPNSTALARPLIAKYLVEVAGKEGAHAVAHGSTGKGNDQVRFDVSCAALDPNINVIAPVRDWNLKRNEEIEYAAQAGIPVPVKKDSPYSVDANLWGRSCECGAIEQPDKQVPPDALAWVTLPEKAPETPEFVTIHFEKGVPTALDTSQAQVTGSVEIVKVLNALAGKHGVGLVDHMEDRTIGLKSREFYECPAATVLLAAHKDIEKMVLTRDENEFKPLADKAWAELTYKGLWCSPLMNALNAFIDATQENVSGWVKVKLYKGSAKPVARNSPYALYDLNLATYDTHTTFNQKDAVGFIKLWGLNTVLANKIRNANTAGQKLVEELKLKTG